MIINQDSLDISGLLDPLEMGSYQWQTTKP